jgi:hypothetical protein
MLHDVHREKPFRQDAERDGESTIFAGSPADCRKLFRAGACRPIAYALWRRVKQWIEEESDQRATYDHMAQKIQLDRTGVYRSFAWGDLSLDVLVCTMTRYEKGFDALLHSGDWPCAFLLQIFGYMELMAWKREPKKRWFQRSFPHPALVAYLWLVNSKYRSRQELLKRGNDSWWKTVNDDSRHAVREAIELLGDATHRQLQFVTNGACQPSSEEEEHVLRFLPVWAVPFIEAHKAILERDASTGASIRDLVGGGS